MRFLKTGDLQDQDYRDSYRRGIQGARALATFSLDLLHGLRRKRIDEVDRNIVKTSQLQTIDIVIDILLLMAPTNLFWASDYQGLYAQRTRLTGEFFKTTNLIRIQISRIGPRWLTPSIWERDQATWLAPWANTLADPQLRLSVSTPDIESP